MAEEKKEEKTIVSDADIKAIEADIAKAQNNINTKEVDEKIKQVKEETKKEVIKEITEKQKLEEIEKQNAELKKQLEEKEKTFKESFTNLKSKVDDLVTSKATIEVADPFTEPNVSDKIDKMSDEEIDKIEEESKRAFFGVDYDERG